MASDNEAEVGNTQSFGPFNVQVMVGNAEDIGLGHVAVVIKNCPISEVDGILCPAFRLDIEQAERLAMNIIHLAKIARERLFEAAEGQ